MDNPMKQKLLDTGYSEFEDEMLFKYADWWWESNYRLDEDSDQLFALFQNSYGFLMYKSRGYVILED